MGYGVLRVSGKHIALVEMDVLRLQKLESHEDKLKCIFEKMLEVIDRFKPDETAVEAPFFGKNVQSMLKLGRAQGVAFAASLYRNIPVVEYSPRKIKQSVTGNGNASKEQVAAMLKSLLKIEEMPVFLDATDALAVAVCHYLQRNSAASAQGGSRSSDWKSFLKNNPDRIK